MKSVKEVFIKSVDSSTIHGISKLSNADKKSSVKIIWAFFIFISLAFCSGLVFSNVSDYYAFDVVTNIEVIPERPVLFPKITFCLYSPFTTNYSVEFLNKVVAAYPSDSLHGSVKPLLPYVIASSLNQTEKAKLSFKLEVIKVQKLKKKLNLIKNISFCYKGYTSRMLFCWPRMYSRGFRANLPL